MTLFLETQFLVPEREQPHPLTHPTTYPNELFQLLGIAHGDQSFVPIFCTEEEIKDWSGLELRTRQVYGKQLLQSIPEGWWITLRPGAEVGKEFSPWEISELTKGPEAIDTVVAEIFDSEEVTPLEYKEPGEDEYTELKENLTTFALDNPEIQTLSLLEHEDQNLLQLGAGISSLEKRTEIEEQLETICKRALVGDIQSRVLVFQSNETSAIALLFMKSKPFYTVQKPSFLSRFLKPLGF